MLNVTDIVSISAVGSLKENISPKTFVIVDQYIDLTYQRKKTFFDKSIVAHVSMAKPTCEGLMNACENALLNVKASFIRGGTYICIEGPQFSSFAESVIYKNWNADVIGMTNMPEAKLAREAEIRYASIAMVTDYDCWHQDYENVSVEQVINTFEDNISNAQQVIKNIINCYENFTDKNDPALSGLKNAIMTKRDYFNKKDVQDLKHITKNLF